MGRLGDRESWRAGDRAKKGELAKGLKKATKRIKIARIYENRRFVIMVE
jgi:hypothetical protein